MVQTFRLKKNFGEEGFTMNDVQQMERFFIKGMYKNLEGEFQKVNRRRLIGNNNGSPKWMFMLWMAILETLNTRDRLVQRGLVTEK